MARSRFPRRVFVRRGAPGVCRGPTLDSCFRKNALRLYFGYCRKILRFMQDCTWHENAELSASSLYSASQKLVQVSSRKLRKVYGHAPRTTLLSPSRRLSPVSRRYRCAPFRIMRKSFHRINQLESFIRERERKSHFSPNRVNNGFRYSRLALFLIGACVSCIIADVHTHTRSLVRVSINNDLCQVHKQRIFRLLFSIAMKFERESANFVRLINFP